MQSTSFLSTRTGLLAALMTSTALMSLVPMAAYAVDLIVDGGTARTINDSETFVAVKVGSTGTGTLTISDGGSLTNTGLASIGISPGSTGTVTVTGTGSWASARIVVGLSGAGTLNILDGGAVSSNGRVEVAGGEIIVSGAGSTLNAASIIVGDFNGSVSDGTLTIADGGVVSVNSGDDTLHIGSIDSHGTLNIGAAAGDAAVAAGTLDAASVGFGGGVGTINFNHTETNYDFNAAISGRGTINQIAGVTNLTGDGSGFTGTTNIIGGTLNVTGTLGGGDNDMSVDGGTLSIESGGVVSVNSGAGTLNIASFSDSTGTLNIGAAEDEAAVAAGTLHAASVVFGDGVGTINFNHTETNYDFNAAISGEGTINQIAGVTHLTGDSSGFTGTANIGSGTLNVAGTLGGSDLNVDGGTLAITATGHITLTGQWTSDSTVTNNGTINGNLTQTAGTTTNNGTITGNVTSNTGMINNTATGIWNGEFNTAGIVTNDGTINGNLTQTAGTTTNNGTITGNVTSNTGMINNTATGIWNGEFNTAGIVTNDGTINGNLTQTAGTTTNNGTITGNGRVSGGLFTGVGSIGDLTMGSGGTLAPGNSIGTLSVANITIDAGSTYAVEFDDGGFVAGTNNDLVNASGTATINGGTVHVTRVNGTATGMTYTPGTYAILTAKGGVTGTFSTLAEDYVFLNFALSYDANNVFLTSSAVSSFCATGMSANQCAAGNGAFSLGLGNEVFDGVLVLSEAKAANALDQLSGEIHASAKSTLIEDSRFIRSAVNDRIRAAFDAVGSSGMVTTYVDGKPVVVKADTSGFAVWEQSFGTWGDTDGDGNAAMLTLSTGGFLFGADAPVFDRWRLGVVAGYSRTSFDVQDRLSSGASDNYHVGLYGGAVWGDLTFSSGASYTWHDISTSRNLRFSGFGDNLDGEYDGSTAQAFGELAYGLSAGITRIEPFANLAYVSQHTDGFTEKGGAAALSGASGSTDTTFTTLGLRASTTFGLVETNLTANGLIGWRHALGDVTPLSTVRFADGGDAFGISGVPIARDAAVIEAGINYAISSNATLGVTYSGQFGSGMSDQSFRVSFNTKF